MPKQAREITLQEIQIEAQPDSPLKSVEPNMLEVRLFFDNGGFSHYDHQERARGWYVSVTAIRKEMKNGYASRTSLMFDSGYKCLLEEAKAFSSRKMMNYEYQSKALRESEFLVERLCSDKGLIRKT